MVNTFIVKLFPELNFATIVAEILPGGAMFSEFFMYFLSNLRIFCAVNSLSKSVNSGS